jgi:CNT family concentrative nucleoside transporter
MQYLIGLAGIVLILAIAVLLSSNRRWIRVRVVAAAFAMQAGIAFLVLYTPWGRWAIEQMSAGVSNLLGYSKAGPISSSDRSRRQRLAATALPLRPCR